MPRPTPAPRSGAALAELALVFLGLGTIGFGGPAAHVALMEETIVRRRGWMTREEFLDRLAVTHLIPGPNSTEMAMHVGQRRAGGLGLVVAGTCFILPAFVMVTAMAWAYVRFGAYPGVAAARATILPVMIAIVVQALWNLGRTAVRSWWLAALGAAALIANLLGADELAVLAVAGALAGLARAAGAPRGLARGVWPIAWTAGAGVASASGPVGFGLGPLFLAFLKIGSVLFGSGYVLLAFLRADFVQRLGWIDEKQLLDAIAVGQITPGPVFTTATFIGYLTGRFPGAVVATVGIFLPAFVLVAISGPIVARIRRSPALGAALDGVVVASLAVMAVVTIRLLRVAVVDAAALAILLVAAVLLFRFRINSAWLVLAAGGLGALRALPH